MTEHFKLSEFTNSPTAKVRGIKNEPNEQQIEALYKLATELLEPLRVMYNEPFIVNSGYRCPELNRAVGGKDNPPSQHTKGEACDIRVKDPRNLLKVLQSSGLVFDQAILYPNFLHLSYKSSGNRKQVLYAKGVKPQ